MMKDLAKELLRRLKEWFRKPAIRKPSPAWLAEARYDKNQDEWWQC